jgi:shikimate 5-dehydrogenase
MKRIEMIGSPIDHVLSPGIMNPMFEAAGEPYRVVAREVRPADLDVYAAESRGDDAIIGLIVTTPLKQAIRAHLDRETALVGFIGASNCVRCDGTDWIGANFDGHGFLAGLADIGRPVDGARILLLGCGGAGGAIAASLVQSGEVDLALCDIDRPKVDACAARLRAFAPRSTIRVVDEPVGPFDIVINASPAGMAAGDSSPLPEETIVKAGVIADIIAVDTPLKRRARALGKPLVEGEAMTRGQVALFRRFYLTNATTEAAVLAA